MSQEEKIPPGAKLFSFPYRRTRMGGFDDTIIISFRTQRPVKSVLRTSRSGRHGSRIYYLFPGRYFAYEVNQSNGGNLYAVVRVIRLGEDGRMETEKEWQVCNRDPVLTLDDLPDSIRTLLVRNKDVLPLFQYVFLDVPVELAKIFVDSDVQDPSPDKAKS